MMKITEEKREFIQSISIFVGSRVVTRVNVVNFLRSQARHTKFPHWITNNKSIRVGRASYDLSLLLNDNLNDGSVLSEGATSIVQ